MNKMLFVSSYDLRRNTSSNIRTIALMQSLSTNGFSVDVAYVQSNNSVDPSIDEALENCCGNIFKLICETTSTNENKTSKPSRFKQALKDKALSLYSRLFVYDVFQTRFRKIKWNNFKKIIPDYDYIISSSEPRSSHKLAEIMIEKRITSGKWIQYWGDPMSNDVASKKLFKNSEKREEKRLLKKADLVLYTNPGCAEYMKNRYLPYADKIFWLPTTDLVDQMNKSSNNGIKQELCISYVGDYLSSYRNIVPLYNVCTRMGIKCTIAGNGDTVLNQNDSVHILGRVGREKAIEIENNSDILAVLDNERKGITECIQVPGKMYHFALTTKYILVITNGDSLQRYYDCFKRYVFAQNNEKSIEKALLDITNNRYCSSFNSPLLDFSQNSVYQKMDEILKRYYVKE